MMSNFKPLSDLTVAKRESEIANSWDEQEILKKVFKLGKEKHLSFFTKVLLRPMANQGYTTLSPER